MLSGAFGTRDSFHMKDGEVVYGPTQPEFKEYLTMINKWYSEGLINSDFPVNDNPGAKILSNEAGSTYASMGSRLIMQSTALAEEYPGAELVSMPWLTGPNGDHSVIYDSNHPPRHRYYHCQQARGGVPPLDRLRVLCRRVHAHHLWH